MAKPAAKSKWIFASLNCLLIFAMRVDTALAVDDPWARAPFVLREAAAWHTGDSIPEEVRRFRKSPGDLPDPTSSEYLISQITNLSLLAALAVDGSADAQCREDAFAQGMYVGGPTRFFGLVEPHLTSIKGLDVEWQAEIRRRVSHAHVVVDALFVNDQELSETETKRVLDRIESDLRIGTPWATVYERFADEFRANGRPTTAIGNLGHFVVFQDPQLGRGHFVDIDKQVFVWEGEKLPRRLWRMKFLDASHVVTLTHATSGDIVRLHSAVYHQTVLYQVQELYRGRATY